MDLSLSGQFQGAEARRPAAQPGFGTSDQPPQPWLEALSQAMEGTPRQSQILVPRVGDTTHLQRQNILSSSKAVSRQRHPSPASNWLQLQPFLDGQPVVVAELGRRRPED